jgi:hypothetical protein
VNNGRKGSKSDAMLGCDEHAGGNSSPQ